MRNEIVEKMDINAYHAHEGISNTGIGYILDCPKRYWYEYLNPDKPAKEIPKHFKIGQALHTSVLEPEKFDNTYCTIPKFDRRTTAGKEAHAEAEKAAKGKITLNEEDFSQVKFMADAMRETRVYRNIMKDGKIEHSFFWSDDEFGVQCKSRPDWHNGQIWLDVKTTASITDFPRKLYNYGYHRQAAIAREAFKKAYNIEYKYFMFLVVEESAPYLTASFVLDQDSLEKGFTDFRNGLRIYRDCLDKKEWPGYPDEVQQIILPPWVK